MSEFELKAKGEDREEGPTNFSVKKNIGGRVSSPQQFDT